MTDSVVISHALYERLVRATRELYPRKVFGYLLSQSLYNEPSDFILFDENIRNSETWQSEFHSYGDYFVNHDDAGFVATPEESWRVQKEIWSRGLHEVGVLHSHQRHPANFSRIDWDMHRQRFSGLWHLIISVRNPQMPQVRTFAVEPDSVRELPLEVVIHDHDLPANRGEVMTEDAAKMQLRDLGRLTLTGRPDLSRARDVMRALDVLHALGNQDVIYEILLEGILQGSKERYLQHIAPLMTEIPSATFEMGSDRNRAGHFYGESPRHSCELSGFQITRTQITRELFGLVAPENLSFPWRENEKPAVNVSWPEASLFALWMGCRLPTEAEWEFCCGAGTAAEWCCESEQQLRRHAWYSVNSEDRVQPVATRWPNKLGLFDMHGNVWEWCLDNYDQDFYSPELALDPVNRSGTGLRGNADKHKVVRGGSMNALAEMCRTRYRFHEPAEFRAADLGFRLVRCTGWPTEDFRS